jgi:peptide/nickel transport system permease protein
MATYIVKRIFYMIIVFLLTSVILFIIYYNVPGDRVAMYMEGAGMLGTMDPAEYEIMRQRTIERYGLDRPPHIQYIRWLRALFSGEFGYSIMERRPVSQVIATPIQNTVRLNIVNLIVVFCITIPLGISSAVKRGKVYDNTVQTVTVIGMSLPTFVTAILVLVVFAVRMTPGFPFGGVRSMQFEGNWFQQMMDMGRHMVLPVMVMAFGSLAGLTRFIRGAMIEALNMDCIRTARAKGVREKVVIFSHALRNAQITVIMVLANWFIGIFSGSVIVERVFNYRGMGDMLLRAISSHDFAFAQAMNMFYIVISLVGLLVIDILFVIADPRIKLTS